MPGLEVLTPSSLDELAEALASTTQRSRLLAGGTDLVRAVRSRESTPDLLIDISGLSELTYVRLHGERLRVGATTTFARLQTDPLVREHGLCLAQAAAQVGSVQIRNVATLAGNVANASPCADGAAALMALGADVTTIDGAGRMATRPLAEVLVASGRTALAHDEAITEFSFASLGPEQRSAFAKIGSRMTVTVARLNLALVVHIDLATGVLTDVRVALGAVGDTAFRGAEVERVLDGRLADEESARLFAEGCRAAVQASIPGRYSLPYKEYAAIGLAYDAWNALRVCPPFEPEWP